MNTTTPHLPRFALAMATALCTMQAHANPTGGQVVSGNASIQSSGNQTTINQGSNRAIINWQSFTINRGESTRFNLPSSSSAVLNRVVGGNPSELLGSLSSNGKVFLINPNGVLVGAGATINTNAFFASTRDVNDQQFMNGGNLDFFGNSNAAITNLGTINAEQGDVVLLAYQVNNVGSITAPAGTVALASGTELLYAPTANDRVVVKAGALRDGGSVSNEGAISAAQVELKAAGGNPYALAVNAGGSISAISLDNIGGRIVLNAKSGTTHVSGDLTASQGDKGGEIIATGQHVALTETANLRASGQNGGGRIAVGGGYQGKDAALQNAETTNIAKGAKLNADAAGKGNGGQITVWANDTTQYQGHASVRGGVNGGDGGFIEVSGKQRLDYRGTVDMLAPQGKNGTLLLDPTDITIVHAGAGSGLTVSGNTSTITDTDLGSALSSGNVILSTTSGGAGNGDITVAADASPTAYVFTGINNTLTLQAERDITVNHSLVVFNNSPGNSGITLQAGRNLAINNPTGIDGDVGILANNLTLIADAANSGNGTSTMTIANGVVLSGDNIRLFVPTQAQLTLSNSTSIGGSTTVGKWVGDAGTSTQGIYYKSANGSSGNNTLTPGTNLTPGQTQVGAGGGNTATVITPTTTTLYQKLFSSVVDINSGQTLVTIDGIVLSDYENFVRSFDDETLNIYLEALMIDEGLLRQHPDSETFYLAAKQAKEELDKRLPDFDVHQSARLSEAASRNDPEINHWLDNIAFLESYIAKNGKDANAQASIAASRASIAALKQQVDAKLTAMEASDLLASESWGNGSIGWIETTQVMPDQFSAQNSQSLGKTPGALDTLNTSLTWLALYVDGLSTSLTKQTNARVAAIDQQIGDLKKALEDSNKESGKSLGSLFGATDGSGYYEFQQYVDRLVIQKYNILAETNPALAKYAAYVQKIATLRQHLNNGRYASATTPNIQAK